MPPVKPGKRGCFMNWWEVIAFIAYFAIVLGIGLYFYLKTKSGGEKEYFLGGRSMNGAVAALSAGASDMSAWVLMGLPGALYASGLVEAWTSVGLFIGTLLAWVLVAPRLRTFSIAADDAITIPQFLNNRFKEKQHVLQFVCAIVFIVAYCIYSAASISACGTLFATLFDLGKNGRTIAMIIATVVIVAYTLLGGFNAVCWTDFFQGMLMLVALMVVPIMAVISLNKADFVTPSYTLAKDYYNPLVGGTVSMKSVTSILSGLGWGLGYFGMPHILVRYMSIRSKKEMKRSQKIGITWTFLILGLATVVGLIARKYLGDAYLPEDVRETVFIETIRKVFRFLPLISGVLLSAIIAASMSTADSQLLTSSSAFSSDIYKPIRKKASSKELLWVGRVVVGVICVIALVIALSGNQTIMSLVSNAWGAFGAAFGPVILMALYWKRFNYAGAVSGIIAGFTVDITWLILGKSGPKGNFFASLYEIVPGFIAGMIVCVVVTLLTKAPDKEVEELFDKAVSMVDADDAEA